MTYKYPGGQWDQGFWIGGGCLNPIENRMDRHSPPGNRCAGPEGVRVFVGGGGNALRPDSNDLSILLEVERHKVALLQAEIAKHKRGDAAIGLVILVLVALLIVT